MITRTCLKDNCFQNVTLFYREQKNATLHLVGKCELHGYMYFPFVGELKLPVVPAHEVLKSKKKKLIKNYEQLGIIV